MNIKLNTLMVLLLLPFFTYAQEEQEQPTSSLDRLLEQYDVQQRQAPAEDPQSELRKLRNQIIDLRVERDALAEENTYLKNRLENVQAFEEAHPECAKQECVPADVVENERILSYVIYSLGLYRMAEVVVANTPTENVEARNQAQRVMAGVKSDLDTLGFDTTNMEDYPTLDELLKEFQIAHNATLAQ